MTTTNCGTIHVTRISGHDVYGHSCDKCDPAGCAGYERFFSGLDGRNYATGDLVDSETGDFVEENS